MRTAGSAGKRGAERAIVWRVIAALALGLLLGSVSTIGLQCADGYPLLHTALRSAFSATAIAALASVRVRDLVLDIDGLPDSPETGRRGS